MRRYYEAELLPVCISIGINAREFWKLNPRTIKPYFDGYLLRREELDREQYIQGAYFYDALSAALYNALGGRKSKRVSYREKPFFEDIEKEDDIDKKIRQAILNEEMWIKASREKGLPDTVIDL